MQEFAEIDYMHRNIRTNHIHTVWSFPPEYIIAKVVQKIKSTTEKAREEKFQFFRKSYHDRGGIW